VNIVFTNEHGSTRTDEIVDHLRRPRLWIPQADYPDYDTWLERVHQQLCREDKQAMVAIESTRVVAAIVYQRHKELPNVLEVKNISVKPEARGRLVASFMLRNVEVEGARGLNASRIVIDAKKDNVGVRLFLLQHRYVPITTTDLYSLGAGQDVVFEKHITGRRANHG
jgi:ribosomal protein S18 acetylase RimI-like enzyme